MSPRSPNPRVATMFSAVAGASETAARRLARVQYQHRRSLLTTTQARTTLPAAIALRPEYVFQLGAQSLRTFDPAGNVVADVGDGRRLWREREEVIEGDNAVSFRGRYRQSPADVVEGARRHPAKPRLDGMERGQKRSRRDRAAWPPSERAMALLFHVPCPACPGGCRWSQDGIDGGLLGCRRLRAVEIEVHRLRRLPAARPGWRRP